MSAERSGGHHCEAIYNHLIKVMVTKRGASGEKANVTHVFKMGKKDDPGNFTSVPGKGRVWKGEGAPHSGGHLYSHDEKTRK